VLERFTVDGAVDAGERREPERLDDAAEQGEPQRPGRRRCHRDPDGRKQKEGAEVADP